MTREELEHAIRAACDVADDSAVYVFGSQAILAEFPDPPAPLRQSMEVDIAPVTRLDRVDRIDGALGEYSQFHAEFGFYVHGLSIEAATLPPGWRDRVIRVSNSNTRHLAGLCVEGHDLAASKLAAFRDKDRDFVRTMLVERMLGADVLRDRVATLAIDDQLKRRLLRWIEITDAELHGPTV